MDMAPEPEAFVFCAALVLFAYVALYPRLAHKSLLVLGVLDLALTALILMTVGAIYLGTGTEFSLVVFAVPWWLFAIVCTAAVELPLFLRFAKKYHIDLNPPAD
jgi:hypothetical protein